MSACTLCTCAGYANTHGEWCTCGHGPSVHRFAERISEEPTPVDERRADELLTRAANALERGNDRPYLALIVSDDGTVYAVGNVPPSAQLLLLQALAHKIELMRGAARRVEGPRSHG
jgi:hypothetical protein